MYFKVKDDFNNLILKKKILLTLLESIKFFERSGEKNATCKYVFQKKYLAVITFTSPVCLAARFEMSQFWSNPASLLYWIFTRNDKVGWICLESEGWCCLQRRFHEGGKYRGCKFCRNIVIRSEQCFL